MKTIELVEQTLYQIKNILINDEVIRKLLYLQTPAALTSETSVSAANVDSLISIIPYVQDEGGIENSAESNFIVIYCNFMSFEDDIQHLITFGIDLFVYKDYFLLNGAKTRPTQILNRIVDLLEDKKLAFAEKFTISDARLTSIEKGKTIGYITTWSVANGTAINY
jgi:hypothetical protein